LLDIHQPFVIRNPQQVVDRLEHAQLPADHVLVAMDVESLYTSIHLSLFRAQLRQQDPRRARLLITLLDLVTENNNFIYGLMIYLQQEGIAMGSNCSVELANVYMLPADQLFAKLCFFYVRYIDDILIIHKSRLSELKRIALTLIPGISFTFSTPMTSTLFHFWISKSNFHQLVRFILHPVSSLCLSTATSPHTPGIPLTAFEVLFVVKLFASSDRAPTDVTSTTVCSSSITTYVYEGTASTTVPVCSSTYPTSYVTVYVIAPNPTPLTSSHWSFPISSSP
jgi:hypothetical protein